MAADAYQAPRGTRDLMPEDLITVRYMENAARELARSYRYSEIRTPLFEETRLFTRSLGETSDVVQKEMFTVPPRGAGSASHTFRPEGTASAARAYVQGGYAKKNPLQKWFYLGPMFRYERPQKGRDRQFTQFGVEAFGSSSPLLDAEVVDLAVSFFERLGFGDELEVRVNTMGDPADRERWGQALHQHFAGSLDQRCDDCRNRFERNIFRLLDCKVEHCGELNADAPGLAAVMAPESTQHHADFLAALGGIGREPIEDSSIVRGLDYYSRSVFEIHYPPLGARSALCGGGRYDGLVEEVGGPPTCAVGFAIGFSPAELAMKELSLPTAEDTEELRRELGVDIYCVAISADERFATLALAARLRAARLPGVEVDFREKSPKAQFKEATKLGARVVCVCGADELAAGQVVVRDMDNREEQRVALDDVVDYLKNIFD